MPDVSVPLSTDEMEITVHVTVRIPVRLYLPRPSTYESIREYALRNVASSALVTRPLIEQFVQQLEIEPTTDASEPDLAWGRSMGNCR